MPASDATRDRRAIHPMKSPLATQHHDMTAVASLRAAARASGAATPPRAAATLAEFADYLRTVTNRDSHPFQPATVATYVYAGRVLDAWMTARSPRSATSADPGRDQPAWPGLSRAWMHLRREGR